MRAQLGEALADAVIEQAEIALKYAGYIDKQNDEVARAAHYEHLKLPDDSQRVKIRAERVSVASETSNPIATAAGA